MALTDITYTRSENAMARGNLGTLVDVTRRFMFNIPLMTSGGGGGLAVRVIGSPIIKTIKIGR